MTTTFEERQTHRQAFLERFVPSRDEWWKYDQGEESSKAFDTTPEQLHEIMIAYLELLEDTPYAPYSPEIIAEVQQAFFKPAEEIHFDFPGIDDLQCPHFSNVNEFIRNCLYEHLQAYHSLPFPDLLDAIAEKVDRLLRAHEEAEKLDYGLYGVYLDMYTDDLLVLDGIRTLIRYPQGKPSELQSPPSRPEVLEQDLTPRMLGNVLFGIYNRNK